MLSACLVPCVFFSFSYTVARSSTGTRSMTKVRNVTDASWVLIEYVSGYHQEHVSRFEK